jgi:TDG/mug DNA glycosylase family protein
MTVVTECDSTAYESDTLAKGLDVIFCSLNPASSAVLSGHNFSHRSNRFWQVLHLAGFTDMLLQPEDERRRLEYGCGITAVVRRPTPRAAEVSPDEFRRAWQAFEARMRQYAPRAIAFLGKRAFSSITGERDVPWGGISMEFAGAKGWILPNPSGLNRAFTLDALVSAYSALAAYLKLRGAGLEAGRTREAACRAPLSSGKGR